MKKYLLTSEEGAFSTLVALLDENLPKKHNGAYLDEYPTSPLKFILPFNQHTLRESLKGRACIRRPLKSIYSH